MRYFILNLIIVACFTLYGMAQQVPVYSQYVFNEFLINPAVAGVDGMISINLSGRKQWAGLKYTPETYSASVSARILKTPFSVNKSRARRGSRGRVGLGTAFFSDKNGALSRTNFQMVYAYHIFVNNYQLSFGLKGFITQIKIDNELITLRDPGDPVEGTIRQSAYIPDAEVGMVLSGQKYRIGISASNLFSSMNINNTFGDIELDLVSFKQIGYFSVLGHYKALLPNREWEVEPAILLRTNKHYFFADFSTRLIYKKEYWIGLSGRTTGDFVALVGLKMKRFYLGYSFDYGFGPITQSGYGSHEIVLAIKLGDSTRRYRWLERY